MLGFGSTGSPSSGTSSMRVWFLVDGPAIFVMVSSAGKLPGIGWFPRDSFAVVASSSGVRSLDWVLTWLALSVALLVGARFLLGYRSPSPKVVGALDPVGVKMGRFWFSDIFTVY